MRINTGMLTILRGLRNLQENWALPTLMFILNELLNLFKGSMLIENISCQLVELF